MSIVRDISEAKAAQQRLAAATEALRASESHYRTVFETSLDLITVTRLADGLYLDVNQAFLDVMGYEGNEVIGRTALDLGVWADPRDRRGLVDMMNPTGPMPEYRSAVTQERRRDFLRAAFGLVH